MLIYWARLFDYSTYWTNFQNNYLFVHCHILGKIIQLLYIDGTTFQCAIIGKYCWIIYEERLEWLEPWQVSLGGEHYLFPEPHYFMNIIIKNLILLCDPSSPVLPCIHCCSGCPTLEGNLRVRRDSPVGWGGNLFRTGKSSDIIYFPKTWKQSGFP